MTQLLDLTDIQGNIVKPYGRYRFPAARFLLLQIKQADKGREFVCAVTAKVTTAVRWDDGGSPEAVPKPKVTINIAFTFDGLRKLELPTASLMGFPQEFVMGMKKRKDILGDDGPSDPKNWDEVWQKKIHIWISIYGQSAADLEERYQWLLAEIKKTDEGIIVLTGHRGADGNADLPYQQACVLFENGTPIAKEHFGYTDGIGDAIFDGQTENQDLVVGSGKLTKKGGWLPLAIGEFLLGYTDEAKEYPQAPQPYLLSRNGTFMVYRKLHQNVGTFNRFLEEQSKDFPGGKELLAAKFVGRWRDNGAPIVHAPDAASKAEWDKKFALASPREQRRMLTDFTFNDDIDGARCPIASHIRRINPRGSLQFGEKDPFDTPGALDNRRRMIRRGLPYGACTNPTQDGGDHGIIFMALNVDIERQFEFVQQQWINYGNDFKEGNDREILTGNHSTDGFGKMVIQAEKNSGKPPYFVKNIPRLVETRGGEYFFIPSLTALRMISKGLIDPT